MPQLIWSPAALRDVARLHAFLAPKNPAAAKRALAAIRQGVRLLGEYPQAGRPMEEMAPEFRIWPIDFGAAGYVVVYRVDDRQVVILAVRHGKEWG
jgi:plasmid stabilization system protein ParE